MNGAKIDAGREAEDLAGAHLSRHGLRIVARNVRYRDGEIDLVCEDRDTLVFVEVRLRRDERFGGSAASITPHKRARVIRAALRYLSSQPYPVVLGPQPADPADTAQVGDRLGQAWVDGQELVADGGCRAIVPGDSWMCTRSTHGTRQHVATLGGRVVAVWPAAPQPAVPDQSQEEGA